MAVFKYYNIQLLAIDTKTHGEVGSEGYKKLFTDLRDRVNRAKSAEELPKVAANLRNDNLFCPLDIVIKDNYAQGRFIKFNRVDRVENLYTRQDEFQGGDASITKRSEFLFVFDFVHHTLAIQNARGLPSAAPLIHCLIQILRPVADHVHPNHQVHIREMTSAQSLQEVFQGERYRRVSVEVTFSNSEELEDELLADVAEYEQNLKANNVHSVTHIERPAKKGSMSGLSQLAAPLLVLAARFGTADVSYRKKDETEWTYYHMRDYPVLQRVSEQRGESSDNFFARIFGSIAIARKETQVGEAVRKELQKLGAQNDGQG